MDSKILVSVIVPIYNVEIYLKRCIESICNQTYKKLEIILVDDGSMDGSGKICDEYALKDSRIKVIHKENGGLSDARNVGIEVSAGEYISLIDSDDYIDPFMIEKLLKNSLERNADITICQYKDVYSEDVEITKQIAVKSAYEMSGKKAIEEMLIERLPGFVVAWNKLYKSSLFKKYEIIYPKGMIHEDCFTTYKLYFYANKVVYLYEPLYMYMHRLGSIMNEKKCSKEYLGVQAYEEILKFVKEHNLDLEEEAEYRYMLSNLQYIQTATWQEKEDIFRAKANIEKVNYKQNSYLKGYKKWQVFILNANPRCYCILNYLIENVKKRCFKMRRNRKRR